MLSSSHLRAACLLALFPGAIAFAQTADQTTDKATEKLAETQTPASEPTHAVTLPSPAHAPVTAEQRRKAADSYLAGAKNLDGNRPGEALTDFTKAAQLDPDNTEYALAATVAREHRLTQLVQQAGRQRLLGNNAAANALLQQAKPLDPDNPVVTQHFDVLSGLPLPDSMPVSHTPRFYGAIELQPKSTTASFHERSSTQALLRTIAGTYGITVTFDSSVTESNLRLDLDDMRYDEVMPIALMMTHCFTVPLTSTSIYIAKDTSENRQRLEPQLIETFDLQGQTTAEMNEISSLLKTVFEVKQVTAVPNAKALTVRAPAPTLKAIHATLDDMISDDGEVLLDMRIYAIDATRMRKLGVSLPQTAGAYNLASTGQAAVAANQSVINQAVASGILTLNGTATQNFFTELIFLFGAGLLTNSPLNNTVAVLGGGITTTGLYIGGAAVNLGYNSTDATALDEIQLRVGDRQDAMFRSGTRYPIATAVYSSSVPNLPSQLQNATVNGTSVSSLLNRLSGSANIPQFQYEDLGLTLKATPTIQKSGMIALKLDLKIEALAGSSQNNMPILANRTFTDQIICEEGQTVLLASNMSDSESRAVAGNPGLSDLPGFQAVPNQDKEADTHRLVILLTPHIVRSRNNVTMGPRIAFTPTTGGSN